MERHSVNKVQWSVYIIALVLIIDSLGFAVVLGLTPSLFEYYASNENDNFYHYMERNFNYFQNIFGTPIILNEILVAGLLVSFFLGLQFLVCPIFGSLSDVYGRKPVFILSLIGTLFSHALWCVSDYFYLFLISIIIDGLSSTKILLSTAIVADLYSENNRGEGMAFISVALGICSVVGAIFGTVLASQGEKFSLNFFLHPTLLSLFLPTLNVVILILFFKESLTEDKRAPSIGQGLGDAYTFINPFSLFSFSPVTDIGSGDKKSLQLTGIIYFIFSFICSGLKFCLCFLIKTYFMFSCGQEAKMDLFFVLLMIFAQVFYVQLIPPGKEVKAALIGSPLIIPAYIIIGLSRSEKILYIGLALETFASATVSPCLTTIASRFGSHSQKGIILGIFRSLGSLARALGPMVFAAAYWSLTPETCFIFGSLLFTIPFILIEKLHEKLQKNVLKEE